MPTPDYTAIEKAVSDASAVIGSTNRELRDQVQSLATTVQSASATLDRRMELLTDSLNMASRSSSRLGIAMIALTLVIAIAAIAQAFATIKQ